jgi:hypothetical protein
MLCRLVTFFSTRKGRTERERETYLFLLSIGDILWVLASPGLLSSLSPGITWLLLCRPSSPIPDGLQRPLFPTNQKCRGIFLPSAFGK